MPVFLNCCRWRATWPSWIKFVTVFSKASLYHTFLFFKSFRSQCLLWWLLLSFWFLGPKISTFFPERVREDVGEWPRICFFSLELKEKIQLTVVNRVKTQDPTTTVIWFKGVQRRKLLKKLSSEICQKKNIQVTLNQNLLVSVVCFVAFIAYQLWCFNLLTNIRILDRLVFGNKREWILLWYWRGIHHW